MQYVFAQRGIHMNSPWLPFLYQYGISGIVFAVGIVLAIRTKALDLNYAHERWTLAQLLAGFAAMMALHGLMIVVSGA